MFDMLKRYFPSLVTYDVLPSDMPSHYEWFMTDENAIVGIEKDELNQKDQAILTTFLTPYHSRIPVPNDIEKTWYERVRGHCIDNKSEGQFRFIYFFFEGHKISPQMFKKAIRPFFTSEAPILWESESSGVLIEQTGIALEESLTYVQMVDTLMSELYTKVRFFIGLYLEYDPHIPSHYTHTLQSAKTTAAMFTDKSVTTYRDAIPSRLVSDMSSAQREMVSELILKDLQDDDDMIQTIQAFIQCNLNTSLTAKKLYMHRNSLQYRIDKFIQVTGIDIRRFEEAVTVYIALLAMVNKKTS